MGVWERKRAMSGWKCSEDKGRCADGSVEKGIGDEWMGGSAENGKSDEWVKGRVEKGIGDEWIGIKRRERATSGWEC